EALLIASENARRILRRYARDNKPGTRLRVLSGACGGNRGGNLDICTGSAVRVRSPETADCDSASQLRFPSRGTLAATRHHAAGCGGGPREIEREYAPAHGAECDQFQGDARVAADLMRSVSGDNQRDLQPFSCANSIRRGVHWRADWRRESAKA